MQEEWRDIKGYEGYYQVSNFGRIKSFWFGREKILKQSKGKNGYLCINLCLNGKQVLNNVHRLVALTFIENPYNFDIVNHKDENKLNNISNNLEWCTWNYNINYGTARERANKSKCKTVYQYLNYKKINTFLSTMDVQRKLGFRNSDISNCCLGRRKSAHGYQWTYVEYENVK